MQAKNRASNERHKPVAEDHRRCQVFRWHRGHSGLTRSRCLIEPTTQSQARSSLAPNLPSRSEVPRTIPSTKKAAEDQLLPERRIASRTKFRKRSNFLLLMACCHKPRLSSCRRTLTIFEAMHRPAGSDLLIYSRGIVFNYIVVS